MSNWENNSGGNNYNRKGSDKFGNPQKKVALRQYINKAGSGTSTFVRTIKMNGSLLQIAVNLSPVEDTRKGGQIAWCTLTKKKPQVQRRNDW